MCYVPTDPTWAFRSHLGDIVREIKMTLADEFNMGLTAGKWWRRRR